MAKSAKRNFGRTAKFTKGYTSAKYFCRNSCCPETGQVIPHSARGAAWGQEIHPMPRSEAPHGSERESDFTSPPLRGTSVLSRFSAEYPRNRTRNGPTVPQGSRGCDFWRNLRKEILVEHRNLPKGIHQRNILVETLFVTKLGK